MKQLEYDPVNGVYQVVEESTLSETSDPTNVADTGKIYTKDVSGSTELFYIDDSGNVIQLTNSGVMSILSESNTFTGANVYSTGSSITFDSGSTVTFNSLGAATCFDRGFNVLAGEININGTTELFLGSQSNLACFSTGANTVFNNGFRIKGGFGIYQTGSTFQLDSGSSFESNAAGADVCFNNGLDIVGGLLHIQTGATLEIAPNGSLVTNAPFGSILFNQGFKVNNSLVFFNNASELDIGASAALDCNATAANTTFANGFALEETTDPTNIANKGLLYVKDDGGDTELFYMDDDGAVVPLTGNGAIKKWEVTDSKTANYTASFGECVQTDATSGGFTITLPDITTSSKGTEVLVFNTLGTNTVTIAADGSDSIIGTASLSSVGGFAVLVSDGTSTWFSR